MAASASDIALGLFVLIAPIAILIVGLGLSRFLPTRKRLIGLILLLIGGFGAAIFGAGFIYAITESNIAAMIGLGSLFAVELATLGAGIVIRRKKSLVAPAFVPPEAKS